MKLITKQLMILLLLSATNAFSQIDYDEEVLNKNSAISVTSLNCILPLGNEHKVFTQIFLRAYDGTQMEHKTARIQGCNKAALEKLSQDAAGRFGFASINLKIVKGIAKRPRIVFGKCQRNYAEQVFLEFDHGLTLKSSSKGMLIPATDC
jgi:hypothetical protein